MADDRDAVISRATLVALARAADAAAVALLLAAWQHRACEPCFTRCSRAAELLAVALDAVLAHLEAVDRAQALALSFELLRLRDQITQPREDEVKFDPPAPSTRAIH
jgi:hypothetical protein